MIFKAKKKDKFAAWLEKNQGGSFTQFYAESVLDALSGKRRHASLGPKLVEGSEDHARKRFDELVAQGINIAGIAQILHLQHRNTELESDNSHLRSENARLRSDKPTTGRRTGTDDDRPRRQSAGR